MEIAQAIDIIEPLSDGIDPFTGEEFPPGSPYQHPQVVRALYLAVSALHAQEARVRRKANLPSRAGEPWQTEEDNRLVHAFKSGKSLIELSEIHQRTEGAIQSRLIKLEQIEPPA